MWPLPTSLLQQHVISLQLTVDAYNEPATAANIVLVRVPMLSGKSRIVFVKFPGPRKPGKMSLVLESPVNLSARSWSSLGSDADRHQIMRVHTPVFCV